MPVNNNVQLGDNMKIFHPQIVNRHDCQFDNESKNVTVAQSQKNVSIEQRCKSSSRSFLGEGVALGSGAVKRIDLAADPIVGGLSASVVGDLRDRANLYLSMFGRYAY